MTYLNVSQASFNTPFAGLAQRLRERGPVTSEPQLKLPFIPPMPRRQRRSSERAKQIRSLQRTTGRSATYCRKLHQIIDARDVEKIGAVLAGKVKVLGTDPEDRLLMKKFSGVSRETRELLVSLID